MFKGKTVRVVRKQKETAADAGGKPSDADGGTPAQPQAPAAEDSHSGLALKDMKVASATHEWGDKDRTVDPVAERFGGGKTRLTTSHAAQKPSPASPAPAQKPVTQKSLAWKPVDKKPETASTPHRTVKVGSVSNAKPLVIGITILVLLMSGVGFLAWLGVRGPAVGYIGSVSGDVTIMRENSPKPIIAGPGARVHLNDTIVTRGPESRTYLLFKDGGVLQIDSDSSVQVSLFKEGTMSYRGKLVTLRHGIIYLELPQQQYRPLALNAKFAKVVTAKGSMGIIFTNDCVTLNVTDGLVQFTRVETSETIDVAGGSYAVVADGMPFKARGITGDTRVADVSLVDAETGQPIAGYTSLMGSVLIDLANVTVPFAVAARAEPATVGSVKFELEGEAKPVIANTGPFIFRGPKADPGGQDAWRVTEGVYNLTITAYSMADGVGKPSVPRGIAFHIVGR